MIHPSLYRNPVMLDARAHRDLKVARTTDDWSVVQGINAIAVAALEFADAAVDFPIVFVRISNEQGEGELVPVAVFGLTAGENLYVQGSSWRARYVPAMLRMYPFGVAGIEDEAVARLRLDDGTEIVLPRGNIRRAKLVLTDELIAATAAPKKEH